MSEWNEDRLLEQEAKEVYNRKQEQIAAAIHLIFVIAIFIVATVFTKKIWLSVLIYFAGYLIIPILVKIITNGIGEVGVYIVLDKFGNFLGREFIGPIQTIVIPLICIGFLIMLFFELLAWLPYHIAWMIAGVALAILSIHILIYPIVNDIVHLFAKEDKSKRMQAIVDALDITIIVLGVVLSVGSYVYVNKYAPGKLNLDHCAKVYVERNEEEKIYIDQLSYKDAALTFQKGSSVCWVVVEGSYAKYEGFEKSGEFTIKLEYDLFKDNWRVRSVSEDCDAIITAPVTYVGQGEEDIEGYKGETNMELTFQQFHSGTGEGSGFIKITDKNSGAIVFESAFRSSVFSSHYAINTEKVMDIGLFGVTEFEFEFEEDEISISTSAVNYELTKQEE